ncbi:MAG: carboxyl transferase domain-containing protein [Anaerovoracaceae bacterium]|jgi:acetyl-CoA carboxylase carboxyltransferase component
MKIKSSDTMTRAYQRILSILDEGSFMETGEHVSARLTSFYKPDEVEESDGVITGYGTVNSNLVFIYAQDGDVMGGTFGEMHGKKIIELYERAIRARAPIIGLLDSNGFRIEEGLDGMNQFAALYGVQAKASGEIPQIMCVTGNCGGGMSISAVMADFVFIENEEGHIYLSPEKMVEYQKGEEEYISAFDDGRYSWDEIVQNVRTLVELLPQSCDYTAYRVDVSDEELNRTNEGIHELLGDGKAFLTEIADNHFFFETQRDKGQDVVTGLIRLNGATIGCCCCNTVDGSKRLSFQGIDKMTSIIHLCDHFNIPILMVIDTEGYQTTAANEYNMPNSAGRLVRALTQSKVAKVSLIAGKAYGSIYSILNSKGLSADYVFMWDDADVSIIEPRQATEMIYGKFSDNLAREYYDTHSSALALARHGYVDKVIRPEETRKYLIGAFETFVNSR